MNVIEKYAKTLSQLQMDLDLFDPNAVEMCPREGVSNLKGFSESLKRWFPRLEKIVVKNIICKHVDYDHVHQLHGVVFLEVYYKVKHGEAKIDAVHVVITNEQEKILSVNSFWALSQYDELALKHPELKQAH